MKDVLYQVGIGLPPRNLPKTVLRHWSRGSRCVVIGREGKSNRRVEESAQAVR
jgi:hypothetical protein